MSLKAFFFLVSLSIAWCLNAQKIGGNLKFHAGQELSLTGFDYYNSQTLGKTTADSLGNFTIHYPKTYKGMAILGTSNNSSLLVLTGNTIDVKGTHLLEKDSLYFTNSAANTNFAALSKRFVLNDKAYAGWRYLKKIYAQKQFADQDNTINTINSTIQYIEKDNAKHIAQLPKSSYLAWFAPLRKLVGDMPQTANNYPERTPNNITQFRNIDFTDTKFKTSGLFRELIEGHYMLLENMGQSLDSRYVQMNSSTDYLLNNLKNNKPLLTNVVKELFTYFEKRSLFSAAAHLSEQIISNHKTVLDDVLRGQMERYVTLKVGNIAPNVQLVKGKTLKNINNNILLIFGSGECEYCLEANQALNTYYPAWQEKGNIEVVYISLDTDKKTYVDAYSQYPWNTYCDYKGWSTQSAIDYFVNGTPTYVLMDKDLKILVHPRSIEQVNSWVKYKL